MRNIFICLALFMYYQPLWEDEFPEIQGWQPLSEVTSYGAENLYEYIDGAADQFLDYGFRLLRTRDFATDSLKLTVDIYDMGSPLNAFGIYQVERPPDAPGLKWGTEAIVSPPFQCLLLKDAYYVKVNVFEGELSDSSGSRLLAAIAAALPGRCDFPAELQWLPTRDLIAGSAGFTRVRFLGMAELTNCIHARYRDGDGLFQYFIILPTPEASTEAIWHRLGQKWQQSTRSKRPILFKNIPYQGVVGVIQTRNKLVGVNNCSSELQAVKRLEALGE
jgi:hypothetical protein